MKIFEYNDVDWQQALELNLTSFDWYLTPNLVKNILNVDKRVPKYFAIYAVEKGEVLGQVGILIDEIKTTNGKEKIGYLWGVCTKANAFRKGVATKLIEEANMRLLKNGVKYSFLGTQKSLIAYNLVKKLGYSDLINSNMLVKNVILEQNKTNISFSTEYNEEMFIEIFSEYAENLLGFVHRPNNFIIIRKAWEWMPLNLIGVFRKNDRIVGYVLGLKEGEIVRIRELCCQRSDDIHGCINSIEIKLKPKHMIFHFISRYSIIDILINAGFSFINPTLSKYMIKNLEVKQKNNQTQSIFGIDKDKFQMTSIDYY